MRSETPASTDGAADEVTLRCLNNGMRECSPAPDAVTVKEPTQEVVLRCEDRAEEWHFDEAVHKSRIIEHRGLSQAFKERERQAKARHAKDQEEYEQRVAEILAAVEAEERKAATELAGLREQLVEAKHDIDELEEDCEAQVVATEEKARAEREKRIALEQELEKEKRSVERATQHITEIEDREGELMRLKRSRMVENRNACQRQLLELQRSGEREIQEIGKGLREEIELIQTHIDQKMAETQRGCDSWVRRRRDVAAETEKHIIETVDTKVRQSLAEVQMQALDAREESFMQIQDVQERDFQQEAFLRERIDAALTSVDCSMSEQRDSISLEKKHKEQMTDTTDILGYRLPNNQYALHDSRRMKSALSYLAGD